MGREEVFYTYCPNDGYLFAPNELRCRMCAFERKHSEVLKDTVPTTRRLYLPQERSDNEEDLRYFLNGFKRNEQLEKMNIVQVTKGSMIVTMQICFITLLLAGFALFIRTEPINLLERVNTTLFIYFISVCTLRRSYAMILSIIAILFTIYASAPMMMSILFTFSDDTLVAISVLLVLIHLASFDYAYIAGLHPHQHVNISLSSGMVLSATLSARSPSHYHTFQLNSFAVMIFVLFPSIVRHLYHHQIKLFYTCFIGLHLLLYGCLFSIHPQYLYAYLIIIQLGCNVVAPLSLLYVHRYKKMINGPWDEAIVYDATLSVDLA